jgi:eukaryotic-like serine/threonine-protein kinase
VPLAFGTRLGPYEITGQIGAGGMGEVYRATDTNLKRTVAIKVLPEAVATDGERLARLQREAEVLARLNHPNIASIYGLEKSDGTAALVMELVEGPTLADRITQAPIPLDEALPIAKQIAEALEAAHEQGIIHRDLKPANVKVRPDGMVKVLDFGLAKAVEPVSAGSTDATTSPTITSPAMMTKMGVILGTAAYMSPEQAKGRAADTRSDVWAFGCVLFEMVTGWRAFEGEDISDTLAAVLRGEPDWTALPAIATPEIRTLIEGCLTKDRKERISSISTVRFLLDKRRVLAAAAPAPFRTRPRWKHVLVVTFVAAIVAAISAIVSWTVKPPTIQTVLDVTRFSIPLGENQELTNLERQAVAISPDGTQVVYVANNRLYLRSMSELEARPIPGTESLRGVTSPAFSPDGRSIVFGSSTDQTLTLKKIAVSGGTPVELCQTDALFGVTWGQDGILFGQGPQGIMQVPAEGGRPELLVEVKDGELASAPQALPDGRGTLFTIASGRTFGQDLWNTARIVVHASKGSEPQTLIEGGADARYLSIGQIIYAVEGRLFAASFDLRDLKVTSKSVPVLEGVARGVATGATQFSVSNSGSLVYIPGPSSRSRIPQFRLALLESAGKTELLKLPPGVYQSPRVSPDGKHLALGIGDLKEADIWIYDLAGTSAMRRLTFGKRDRFPVWSANGQYVAFQSEREGDRAIFWQRADFSGTAERLTRPQAGTAHIPESWSPQGNVFTYSVFSDSTRRYSLASFSIETKESHSFRGLTSTLPLASDFSPDGRWLAYNVSDTVAGPARSTVVVEPFPPTNAKYQISETRNGFHPSWLPDGKKLTYSTGVGPDGPRWVVVNITMQPRFTIGDEVRVSNGGLIDSLGPAFSFPGGVNEPNYDFTPDGRRIGIIPVRDDVSSSPPERQHIQLVLNWLEELKRLVPTK